MRFCKYIISIFILAFLASGCSHLPDPAKPGLDKAQGQLTTMKQKKDKDHKQKNTTEILEHAYIGPGKKVELSQNEDLPNIFRQKVVLVEKPMYLYQVANKISDMCNIPVGLAPGLKKAQAQNSGSVEDSFMPPDEGGGETAPVDDQRQIKLDYTGELTGLLDAIVSHYGLYWRYDKGKIHIRKYDTRTFTLASNIGKVSTESILSNKSQSGSGSSDGDSQSMAKSEEKQEATIESEYSIVEETLKNVENILSENGKAMINRGAGGIVVTDTPSVLDQVATYIEQINTRLSRQVALEVKVYSLRLNDESSHQFNLKTIFNDLNDQVNLALNPVSGLESKTGIGSLTATILKSAGEESAQLGQWSESQALFEALEKQGDVSLVTSGSGIVLNNQSLPIQNIKRTGYLAETELIVSEDGGDTASLTPGEVTTGFSMLATPNIMPNNNVFLQYNISLSSLDNLNEFSSNGSTIQIPEVSSRSFMQRVKMRLGSTLVLGGFEKAENKRNGSEGMWGVMGKAKYSRSNKNVIIVAVTVNDVS